MFVDNEIVKNMESGAVYDKFAFASTMIDVSFRGAACSILEAKVMKDCTTWLVVTPLYAISIINRK